ncbi:putative F-box/LRR-repeat/kelch-repeat protein At1g11620 [Neltuma alba]|uniref:putative F-box/LRR-repeat/kelch-repeat protein At1g11620 n=1 Tax=Neltuma alba TaxID=207710 RepID=UPI0010A590F7|nr:putative F-box/LRR-repeat/kelch-repeat protein At1g11620 [Prosopis alba]
MDGHPPFLPEEIMRNILKRLPVKSLIRFRCVRKDWKYLLKTPSFINDHLRHSRHQNPSLLFHWNGRVDPWELYLLDFHMKLRQLPNTFAIGETRRVSETIIHFRSVYRVGLGFSPILNDYKIVLVHMFEDEDEACGYRVIKVEVHSFCAGLWREVGFGDFSGFMISADTATANGNMFWFGTEMVSSWNFHVMWKALYQLTTSTLKSIDPKSELFTLQI